MNWIKCTDRLPDTSRMVEIASMVEPEEQGPEEYRHYQDSNTIIDGYYQDGAWYHVTGNPIDRIMGFEPKMWRDKDNVCNKG